jgi:hypothetical protein
MNIAGENIMQTAIALAMPATDKQRVRLKTGAHTCAQEDSVT